MYHFRETQRFRQWWIWVILVLAAAVPFAVVYFTRGEGDALDATQLLTGLLGAVLALLLFRVFRLEVTVNDMGITYRFFPMHFSEKSILWDDVESVAIRKYKPLFEYGGWGMRYSFRNGRAFNVSGNMGMQLVLKNGKKILLGTQKAEELEMVLKGLGKG